MIARVVKKRGQIFKVLSFQEIRYGKMLRAFFQTIFALHTHGCQSWFFRNNSAVLEKIHHFCHFILENMPGIIPVKTAWNIHAGRAGHAILASCASDPHHLSEFSRRFLDQFFFFFRKSVWQGFFGQGQVFGYVVIVVHSGKNDDDLRMILDPTQGPLYRRFLVIGICPDVLYGLWGCFRQIPTPQKFHD